MKKSNIFHPKLYFKYEIINNKVQLFYYSNKLNDLGERLVESIFLTIKPFSNNQIKTMNKQEYRNLLIYIKRQEKVMETYLKKGFNDQYLIVKDSIKLMNSFKEQFENWFLDYNSILVEAD
ncbi:hypothetical protein OAI93_00160 [bacterium]|jgi:hypothetical protein|nr:hypothetical protein [bacterium]